MRKMWPVALAVALFVGYGLAQVVLPAFDGSNAVAAADVQARLDRVPLAVGPWRAQVTAVPPKQLQIAEAQAHLSRVYTHERTKAAVAVLLLCGAPGPLGAHTPEVCYEGAGFRQVDSTTAVPLKDTAHEFWTTRFEAGTGAGTFQVLWGWGSNGAWKAAENPRLAFAGSGVIYKLYASRAVPAAGRFDPAAPDATETLLGPLLAELQASLTGPAPQGPAGAAGTPPSGGR